MRYSIILVLSIRNYRPFLSRTIARNTPFHTMESYPYMRIRSSCIMWFWDAVIIFVTTERLKIDDRPSGRQPWPTVPRNRCLAHPRMAYILFEGRRYFLRAAVCVVAAFIDVILEHVIKKKKKWSHIFAGTCSSSNNSVDRPPTA